MDGKGGRKGIDFGETAAQERGERTCFLGTLAEELEQSFEFVYLILEGVQGSQEILLAGVHISVLRRGYSTKEGVW